MSQNDKARFTPVASREREGLFSQIPVAPGVWPVPRECREAGADLRGEEAFWKNGITRNGRGLCSGRL